MKPEITISRHKKALMLKDGVIKPPKKKVAKRKNTGVSRTTVRFSVKKKSAKKTTKKRRKIQMNKEQKELIRKLNLKSVVGCKEEYKYNKAGQITFCTYSDGTTAERHYNKAGQVTLCTYSDGTTTEWHYNKAGQVTLCKFRDGTTAERHYNKAGQLTLRKDTNNTYWIDEKPYRKEEK